MRMFYIHGDTSHPIHLYIRCSVVYAEMLLSSGAEIDMLFVTQAWSKALSRYFVSSSVQVPARRH